VKCTIFEFIISLIYRKTFCSLPFFECKQIGTVGGGHHLVFNSQTLQSSNVVTIGESPFALTDQQLPETVAAVIA